MIAEPMQRTGGFLPLTSGPDRLGVLRNQLPVGPVLCRTGVRVHEHHASLVRGRIAAAVMGNGALWACLPRQRIGA